MPVPAAINLYHIAHGDRLRSIVSQGGLCCDATMAGRGGTGTTIGYAHIKQRRRVQPVSCHPGTFVGDYVPFYFCPRSPMLHAINRRQADPAGTSELEYAGGQMPILHLESHMQAVVCWADEHKARWAFTTGNAAAHGVRFFKSLDQLEEVDWTAVHSRYWQEVQTAKQAEFLVYRFFPWHLVARIGVLNESVRQRVAEILRSTRNPPAVATMPGWYY